MKDFDKWNEKKKKVHNHRKNKFYHPRDIWWCSLGLNVGFEQDGTGKEFQRPVLILRGLGKNIDTKRLFKKTGRLNIEKFEEIKKAVNGLV